MCIFTVIKRVCNITSKLWAVSAWRMVHWLYRVNQ